MAGRPLLLRGVCGPTSCRGLCHVAPRPQRHAARAVLSREQRTRHQSETNRETGPTDCTLSPRKRVWCFLPPSISDSFSLFLFFSPHLSSLLPFLSFRSGERATHHASWKLRASPRCLYHPQPTCDPSVLCVYARPGDESVSRWDISWFTTGSGGSGEKNAQTCQTSRKCK